MAKIVILGAGPTGLSAAYHLEKNGFFDYLIFEKEHEVGGLCRSIKENGFTFDYTGHLLHLNNEYVRTLIDQIADLSKFNYIDRKSYIYCHNTFTKYPFQCNLYGLPPDVITSCIEGYLNRKKSQKKVTSFYDWVLRSFGRGMGEHFFFPYQQKIFSYDVKKITASWTGRFVPATNLKTIIEGAITQKTESVGYNAHFYYPTTGGISYWVSALEQTLKNKIHCQQEVTSIDLQKKIITFKSGHTQPYEHLISTLPLNNFLSLMREPAHIDLKKAVPKLRCNSVINLNLGIKGSVSDKHWIYYPEQKYPFYRIGFYHNFSKSMAPQQCSSLYAEFSYLKETSVKKNARISAAREAILQLFSLNEKDIIHEKILDINHAYVIFNNWRDNNVPAILQTLKNNQVHSRGRYGEWKYASMQEAVLDGKDTVDTLMRVL